MGNPINHTQVNEDALSILSRLYTSTSTSSFKMPLAVAEL